VRARVGLDFIDQPPFRFVSTVDLTITPEQVFEVLDDAESWPQWATLITKVTWSSPATARHRHHADRRHARRHRRRRRISGPQPFSHMAFRFNEALTGSIAAFAEDYRIVPTASGCNLTWVMAMKPKGVVQPARSDLSHAAAPICTGT